MKCFVLTEEHIGMKVWKQNTIHMEWFIPEKKKELETVVFEGITQFKDKTFTRTFVHSAGKLTDPPNELWMPYEQKKNLGL